MSNSFILALITLFTVAQIVYCIKKNTYEVYLDSIQFFWSWILITITFLAALIMPIKFVSKEKIPPSFISYDGATYLITGKTVKENGLAVMEVNNTNITVDKVTFESFFGYKLVDYEIIHH